MVTLLNCYINKFLANKILIDLTKAKVLGEAFNFIEWKYPIIKNLETILQDDILACKKKNCFEWKLAMQTEFLKSKHSNTIQCKDTLIWFILRN